MLDAAGDRTAKTAIGGGRRISDAPR